MTRISRKRMLDSDVAVWGPSNKRRKDKLARAHRTIEEDVSINGSPNITISDSLRQKLADVVVDVGPCKIQFCVELEFTKDDSELKKMDFFQ